MLRALQSHMVTEWHTCAQLGGARSCARGRWSRRWTPRQAVGTVHVRADGPAVPGPRQPWIGKIITMPLSFLKTLVSTRGHRVKTTATARRPASIWADRCTRSTHRRPWGPWSRPAFLTLALLSAYPACGRIQVCLSSTTHRVSSSSPYSPSQAMETQENRADITSLSPGWKPPNLTRISRRDSGQVNPQTTTHQEMSFVLDHDKEYD